MKNRQHNEQQQQALATPLRLADCADILKLQGSGISLNVDDITLLYVVGGWAGGLRALQALSVRKGGVRQRIGIDRDTAGPQT